MEDLVSDFLFRKGHAKVKEYLESFSGKPFDEFQHDEFVSRETRYKRQIIWEASNHLELERWKGWQRHRPGKILEQLRIVCDQKIAQNLIQEKYGKTRDTAKPLYRIEDSGAISEFEGLLFTFFTSARNDPPAIFGSHFEKLMSFGRANSLHINWAFISYLAFLANHHIYFPFRPKFFEKVLELYEIEFRLQKRIKWINYSRLLNIADQLKVKLNALGFSVADAIQIQSYMWVLAAILKDEPSQLAIAKEPDFLAEFERRTERATKREEIGLLGEQFIYEQERKKLNRLGRSDLANRVQLVSEGNVSPYDIKSFSGQGQEIHIEVKSTSSLEIEDKGFWISEREATHAKIDDLWTIVRVWGINSGSPQWSDIGNVIAKPNLAWDTSPDTWFVKRK